MTNVLSAFECAWRSEFNLVLIDFIREQRLAGLDLSSAIKFLARHDEAVARSWVDDQLKSTTPNDLPTSVALALGLFSEELWQQAKSKIVADPSLAVASLQTLADLHASSIDLLEKLNAVQLGDLFTHLEAAFPSVPPIKIAVDDESPLERVEKLRNFVPERFQALASNEACDQLVRLAGAVPHWRTALRRRLRDTRRALLRNTWSGISVNILAAMAAKRESRWIRSEDDLQELVLDSISRLQDELNRTEFPIVRRLWNEGRELRPKDESGLTQELARWLRDDLGPKNGIALGCQVKPSPIHETDIEVWAHPGSTEPRGVRFVVTMEVKRSFNPEVGTSLEKQLIAEYLLKLNRSHGIYLVGWYKGKGWKPRRNPLRAQTWSEAKAKISGLLLASRHAHPGLQIDAVCLNCEFPQAFRKRC
ncbi:MAG: hypothetical protein M1608_02785 [Candidatus Omnitrophica bacterium]|nr:hypothetical protein [Candidatus Omnitrophota bacterium]